MAIPIAQLDTWAKQGSITQSSTTYATVKNALESSAAAYSAKNYNVFLQGSYCNDTNIYAESDVDTVIRLDSIFHYSLDELSDVEKAAFNNAFSGGVGYSYASWKTDVTNRLKAAFGSDAKPGTKAIKIVANGSRRNADVVVATEFRRYQNFLSLTNQRCVTGICFFSSAGDRIVNYPKQHSDNCSTKHQATKSCFKPMVRILKNARVKLANDGKIDNLAVAPSYFLEGLMYNVPNFLFTGSYQDMIVAAFNWIMKQNRSKFVTANEQFYLLGNSAVTWPAANCDAFLNAFAESKQRNAWLQTVLIEAAKLAPRWNPQLAALHARQLELGHPNRATLQVARKLVAYLLAVDKSGQPFQVLTPPPTVKNATKTKRRKRASIAKAA